MRTVFAGFALLLLLSLVAGILRVIRGPTPADRMLAAQLFGTTGVAIIVLLAEVLATPALLDVALIVALLATTAMVAFVRRSQPVAGPSGRAGRVRP